MAVVFAVLAILAISIKLFDKADSAIPDDADPEMALKWVGKKIGLVSDDKPAESVEAPAAPAAELESTAVDEDALTAAAIAVALALAERDNISAPVPARAPSASTGGSWSASGRARQMSNLMPRPSVRRSR